MRTQTHAQVAAQATALLFFLSACTVVPDDRGDRVDAAMQSRPLVLAGEVHDNGEVHRVRAAGLRRLVESGARPALLMEQFDRERQADLDRALAAPNASPEALIAAATAGRPDEQGWSWTLYRPVLVLAIAYRLPIVAANVSRADTQRVVRDGLAASGFDPAIPADIADAQAQAIVDTHCGLIDRAGAARLTLAQVARDQFMARSIERYADRGVVLIAGNGHVRSDVGVPRWLSAATRARSVSIGFVEAGDASDAFDVAITVAPEARPDPCAAMRRSAAGT